MATGTSAGLLDSSDHAQSAFKHAIIRHYMGTFLAMTGSTSELGPCSRNGRIRGKRTISRRYHRRSAELIMQAVLPTSRFPHGSNVLCGE